MNRHIIMLLKFGSSSSCSVSLRVLVFWFPLLRALLPLLNVPKTDGMMNIRDRCSSYSWNLLWFQIPAVFQSLVQFYSSLILADLWSKTVDNITSQKTRGRRSHLSFSLFFLRLAVFGAVLCWLITYWKFPSPPQTTTHRALSSIIILPRACRR